MKVSRFPKIAKTLKDFQKSKKYKKIQSFTPKFQQNPEFPKPTPYLAESVLFMRNFVMFGKFGNSGKLGEGLTKFQQIPKAGKVSKNSRIYALSGRVGP